MYVPVGVVAFRIVQQSESWRFEKSGVMIYMDSVEVSVSVFEKSENKAPTELFPAWTLCSP